MKIKHWAGYGSVNAKKISKSTHANETTMVISVTGNHECGLRREDKYDAFNWLLKRFDKTVTDSRCIKSVICSENPSYITGMDVDECIYTIKYAS